MSSTVGVSDHRLNSVLEEFRKAKTQLSNFVHRLIQTATPLRTLVLDENDDIVGKLNARNLQDELRKVLKSLENIGKVLERQSMKITFFGRTSSGKSSLINAILGQKILPSDPGHSTNCFIDLRGTDSKEISLCRADGTAIPLENIRKIASALRSNTFTDDSVLYLSYPRDKCPLLREDIVFLDTPGLDLDESMDSWIADHCLDCDIFVLLINSESTITSERRFFNQLRERLPDSHSRLFVIFNRWDAVIEDADDAETLEQVRRQHSEKAREFLQNFPLMTPNEEKSKNIFFLSAKKALLSQKSLKTNEDTQGLENEFKTFVLKLMESTSVAAIQRKIAAQTEAIMEDIDTLLNTVNEIRERARRIEDELTVVLEAREKLRNTIERMVLEIMSMETNINSVDLVKVITPLWGEYVNSVVKQVAECTIESKEQFVECFLKAMKDLYPRSTLMEEVRSNYERITQEMSKIALGESQTVVSVNGNVVGHTSLPNEPMFPALAAEYEIRPLTIESFHREMPEFDLLTSLDTESYFKTISEDLSFEYHFYAATTSISVGGIAALVGGTLVRSALVLTASAVAGPAAIVVAAGAAGTVGTAAAFVGGKIAWQKHFKPWVLNYKNNNIIREKLMESCPFVIQHLNAMLLKELFVFSHQICQDLEDSFQLPELRDVTEKLRQLQDQLQSICHEFMGRKMELERLHRVY